MKAPHRTWRSGSGRRTTERKSVTLELPAPGEDEVLVRALYSGVSRGTESTRLPRRGP